jgi:hypothetical protein
MTSIQSASIGERGMTLQRIIAESGHTFSQHIIDFTRLATAVQSQRFRAGVSNTDRITRSTALWVLMQLDGGIRDALMSAGIDQRALGEVLSIGNVPDPVMTDAAELEEYFGQAMLRYMAGLSDKRPIGLADLAAAILYAGRNDSGGLLPGRLKDLKVDFDTAIRSIDGLIPLVPGEGEDPDSKTPPGGSASLSGTPSREAKEPAAPTSLLFPPDEPFLVGREDAVERLVAALRQAGTVTTDGSVVLITGASGKGAVVRRAAHLVPELFPDGRYWIDWSGMTKDPLGVALAVFGIVPSAEFADKVAAYRSLTDGKRSLVVLEYPSEEQFDACRLHAPGSATVVITTSLTVDEAERIELAPFDRLAQMAILLRTGEATAVDQDPAAVDRLLALADDDLTMLGIFANVLAGGVAAADLADFAEVEFPILDDLPRGRPGSAVEAVVKSLTSQERRIFPWLALIPEGRSFAVEHIAEALSESVQTIDALLSRLSRDGAVERLARGQFRIPRQTRDAAGDLLEFSDDDALKLGRIWLGVLKREARRPIPVYPRRRELVSLDADVVEGGTDLLDMKRDVDALSYVVAAKDLTPPLSVGLFGDWGTGKTFFMDLMRRKISQLSADSANAGPGNTHLCSNVRQVVFNAWHYIDANLWASLVTHILTELARPQSAVSVTERAEHESQALLEELATSRALQDEAQNELDSIKRERRDLDDDLVAVRNDRQGLIQKLRSVPLAFEDLRADPDLKNSMQELGNALGRDLDGNNDVAELKSVASDLQGLGGQIRETKRLLHQKGKLRWGWLFALAVIAAIAAVLLAIAAQNWARIVGWAAAVTLLVGAVADYVTKLQKPIKQISDAVGMANNVLKFVGQIESAKQRELELTLDALDIREEQLHVKIHESEDREQQVHRQIEDIQQGRSLYRYIEERARSGEYQKYLGLVSLVRKDFETLTLLMEQSRLQAEKAAGPGAQNSAEEKNGVRHSRSGKPLPRIDRVILYIDDLDRCPADRVVEVLEAVHLLLAFKLFVVVVGVDSRWLLRSLERHYSGQLAEPGGGFSGDDEEAYWASTPQNYLEKIFQVPFSIRPMGGKGYQNLITELLRSSTATAPADLSAQTSERHISEGGALDEQPSTAVEQAEQIADADDKDRPVQSQRAAHEIEPLVSPGAHDQRTEASVEVGSADPAPLIVATGSRFQRSQAEQVDEAVTGSDIADDTAGEHSDLKPEALLLQHSEVEYMKRLAQLVATPRAAKRLINTYRLLRVSLNDLEYSRFAPAPEGADHYMIVQLLLGILVGFPNQVWPLFRSLAESERTNWWDFWGDLREEHDQPNQSTPRQKTADAPGNGWQTLTPRDSEVQSDLPDDPTLDKSPSEPPSYGAAQPLDRESPGNSSELLDRESPRMLDEPLQPQGGVESGRQGTREQPQSTDLQWERLFEVFDELPTGVDLPTSLDAFKYWAHRVSRYSFHTGRLAALTDPDAALQ